MSQAFSVSVKFLLALLVVVGLVGLGGTNLAAQDIRDISISAWTVGPDDPSITRQLQLDIAANRLNAALEFSRVLGDGAFDVLSAETAAALKNVLDNVEGAPNINVVWSSEFNTDNWSSFKTRNLLAFQTRDPNQIADIIVTGHEMVGPHSAADPSFIRPLDDLVARYDATWGDFIQSTFGAARAGNTLFAVPQDTEARVVWYRTDLLKEAGVSDAVIKGLRANVQSGDFTLEDLKGLGTQLVSSGVVEKGFGVSHRPTPGTDWYQLLFSFGGQIFDSAQNKLVLDRGPALKALQYMDGMIKDGIMDPGIASAGWGGVWNQWYNNKVGIFLTGGTWHWAQFKNDTAAGKGFVDVAADAATAEAWQFKNLEFTLIPAGDGGKPNTASHPIVTMLSAVSPPEKQELAFAIVTLAQAVDLANLHSLGSGHMPVRKAQLESAAIQNDKFITEASSLAAFSQFAPNHPGAPAYQDAIWNAIQAVEVGGLSPEQALDNLEAELKQNAGADQVIVKP